MQRATRLIAPEPNGLATRWEPCSIESRYSSQTPDARADFGRSEFEEAQRASSSECIRTEYASGGLRVVGFVYRPAPLESGRRYPAIIYNRGGNADFGTIDDWDKGSFTFLSLRRGAPVKAAATVGAVSDLENLAKYRPEFFRIWNKRVPHFASRPIEEMRDRSALFRPEKIHKPLLLLHGGSDRRVPPEQSLRLADALRRNGREVEVRIYPGDDHMLPQHGRQRDARIVEWFRRFSGDRAS